MAQHVAVVLRRVMFETSENSPRLLEATLRRECMVPAHALDLECRRAWQECLSESPGYVRLARFVLEELGARALPRGLPRRAEGVGDLARDSVMQGSGQR